MLERKAAMTFSHLKRRISLFASFVLALAVFTLANHFLGASPVSASGTWSSTDSMAYGRLWHTAVKLPNGNVLVSGSIGGPGDTAEVYDSSAGTWSTTGSMINERWFHSLTVLPDGKILAAGGVYTGGINDTAEIYDPSTGTWTATGTMNTPRQSHGAILLPDGKVLVAGGGNDLGPIITAEIYDPSTGTWSYTSSMADARCCTVLTELPNGKILFAGGGTPATLAEIYDPATGTWSSAASLAVGRGRHTMTLLPNGKVVAVGGVTSFPNATATTEVYDSVADSWTTVGSTATPRAYHTGTLLNDGTLLVAGGAPQYNNPVNTTELFDPATGTWASAGNMSLQREGHTATLLDNGNVLVTGGGINASFASTNTAEIYEITPDVSDFVLLGAEGMYVKDHATVHGGDVGTNQVSTGPYLASGVETTIGIGVSITDPLSAVFGNGLKLKNNSQVTDAYYNTLSGDGTVLGSEFTPTSFPLVSLPIVPSFSPGTTDVTVAASDSQTLAAGSYGELLVNHDAVLTLSGGEYNFESWDIRDDAKVYASASTEVRIADKLDAGSGVQVGPEPSSGLDASDVVIYVTGVNGSNGNLGATPKAAKFGQNNIVQANVYAENGTLWLRDNTMATGAFLAKWVVAGTGTDIYFDSAF
jgi:N-acetylneuraminic acid mutarotase